MIGQDNRISNLAVVGRCISAMHEALASVRLQSHCMVMGQGVGTCAALALNSGVSMAKFDIGELQSTLRNDGVYLENLPFSQNTRRIGSAGLRGEATPT